MGPGRSAIIGVGLCFLVVFSPLAFGSVYPWAFSLLELVAFGLLLVWLLGSGNQRRSPQTERKAQTLSLYLPFVVFVGLVLFQMVPMPPGILRSISPQTHALYREVVHGYDRAAEESAPHLGEPAVSEPIEAALFLEESKGRGTTPDRIAIEAGTRDLTNKGFFHDWRSLSVYTHATKTELLKVLAYAVTFLLVLLWVDNRSKLLRLLYLMVMTGTFIAVVGMAQRWVGAERIYGFWKPLFRSEGAFFGSYVNPNHFAGYMALLVPISVVLLIRHVERMGPMRGSRLAGAIRHIREPDLLVALVLFLATVVMVSGIFVSLSRGGMFAFAGSMVFLVAGLSLKGGWLQKLGLALMIGFFIALFVFWLGFLPFQAEVKTLRTLFQDPTMQYRLEVWKDSWKMLVDFPLFGTGLGTFAHIYPTYKTVASQATVMYPENDFLQILVETGLVGFGALVWFLTAFFGALWVGWKRQIACGSRVNPKLMIGLGASIIAILIHGLGDFNLHIPANALQLAVVMGLAMTLTTPCGRNEGSRAR